MDLPSFREQFETHLRRFLLKKTQDLENYAPNEMMSGILAEPARLFEAGGKRVRPLFCVAGYELAGGKDLDKAYSAAVALELFHGFAVIHDDIIDRGEERHGAPTVHRSIEQKLRADHRRGELAHVGVGQAIIVGDLLLAWAFEAFTSAGFSEATLASARRVFFTMVDEVMMGQMLDIDLTTRAHSSYAELEQKMALKTAGYTFIRPFEIGLALAENQDEQLRHLGAIFCRALGVAFQIQDDIVDAFGTVEETGKTPLSDIRDHQHSYLTQWVAEHGNAKQLETLHRCWGNSSISLEEGEQVRRMFVQSGALTSALAACEDELTRARAALQKLQPTPSLEALFSAVIKKAVPEELLQAIRVRSSV